MERNFSQANWNQRYQGENYLFGKAPNAFLKRQAHLLKPGMRALAIADGEGRNGVWLAEHGLNVLSIDFSEIALAKAVKLASERGVKLNTMTADLATWDWAGGPFDLIVSIFFHADPVLRAKIFRDMKKHLAPRGLVLLEGYGLRQLEYRTGGPPTAENLYTAQMLREAFADFEILNLDDYDGVIEEGMAHKGMSALVDLVARKPAA
jgi:cyclopropane fatty-acyl-phospholipid synthase-like methyltransferase